jgi:hypothetical protein
MNSFLRRCRQIDGSTWFVIAMWGLLVILIGVLIIIEG